MVALFSIPRLIRGIVPGVAAAEGLRERSRIALCREIHPQPYVISSHLKLKHTRLDPVPTKPA